MHTFFKSPKGYQVIEINNFVLVNQFDANNKEWEVAIFTKENYKKVEEWKKNFKNVQEETLPSLYGNNNREQNN